MTLTDAKSKSYLAEVARDARAKQGRLSPYELGFLGTLESMVSRGFGVNDLTEKQQTVFERIEEKIYAAG